MDNTNPNANPATNASGNTQNPAGNTPSTGGYNATEAAQAAARSNAAAAAHRPFQAEGTNAIAAANAAAAAAAINRPINSTNTGTGNNAIAAANAAAAAASASRVANSITHPQSTYPQSSPTSFKPTGNTGMKPNGTPSRNAAGYNATTVANGGKPVMQAGTTGYNATAAANASGSQNAANTPTTEGTAGANVEKLVNKDGLVYKTMEKVKEMAFRYNQKRVPKQEVIFPSYAKIKKVLILFESDFLERNSQLKQLVKEIQMDGKVVTAWGYSNKKQTTSAILRDYRVIGQKDFTWYDKPKDYEIQDLQNEHFDLLINLNVNNLRQLRYLSLYADADFRAGLMTEEPYESNFMVIVPEEERNIVYLFDQIMKYIRRINA